MKIVMRQSRKRKSNPMKESLSWSKTKRKAEFESQVASSSNALLVSKEKAISVLKGRSQEIIPDVSSSKRCLPRLQYNIQARVQEQINAAGSAGYSGEQAPLCSGPPQNVPLLEDNSDQGLVITLDEGKLEGPRGARRRGAAKRKREEIIEALRSSLNQEAAIEVEIDQQLDQELESKSRQHNLTTVNVRNIIHEVITNEHVVAMMKAAIAETEAVPVFEPKMTRSKLKEVVEKGVVIPTWNISPIKKSSKEKATQFVDIPLEEEDSSDDEYCPDEDEEDETAEETLLESDMESTASSPRGTRVGLPRALLDYEEQRSGSPSQGVKKSRHLQVEVVPMGPPPPPQPLGLLHPPIASSECSFMEKLHAVEEELATGSICMEPYQALSGSGHGDDLMAFRTRSKRPLRDVPLGQLEAELRAPDITPDMYECGSGPEDREWAQWLQGIMASDMENEEEVDDDDDPEYNFLEDIDEPDVEDYRNDRAVRITKKEVNELMEELFDTFHDDPGVQEGHEEEEKEEVVSATETPKFNVPQSIQFEEPLACMLTKRHRTVREQLEALRQHRALFGEQTPPPPAPAPPCTLMLNTLQREQLQQQVQQHTQLLIQVCMLTHSVTSLQNEAKTSQLFLAELHAFAQRTEEAQGNVDPCISAFRACNLQGALSLLEELKDPCSSTLQDTGPLQSMCSVSGRSYPVLPAKLAWLFATRPVFLYPELLPHCTLDPSLHPPRSNTIYTRGEESLVVLGLRNFNETNQPYQLICQYLVCAKKPKQLRRHVHDMCHRSAPASPIKFFCEHKQVPPLPLACRKVRPDEQCPPVEREEAVMPMWLRKSLPYIHKAVEESNCLPGGDSPPKNQIRSSYTFAHGTSYPLSLPRSLVLRPAGFRHVHPASAPCLKPGMSKPPASAVADSTPPRLGGQMALPNKKERARQMPARDLCPIQPAPPKPPPLELQLLPVPSAGVLNVVDLSRRSVGKVSLLEGEDTFELGPASGCASISPAVVFGLVSSVVSSVVNPTLGGMNTRPFLLASSKNVNSSDPLGPTQNVTPLTAFPQSSLNPVSIAVMNNRTVLQETPANKIPSCDAFLASCSSWKQNMDSQATTGAVCTSEEVFTSPLGMWQNHTALLGETETQDVPVLTVSQEQGSCATRPPPQSCLILAKPPSNMQSHTGSVTLAVSQTEAQHSVVSQGRVDHVATTTKPAVTNCGVTKPVNVLDCSEVPVALNTGSHASEPFSYSDTKVPKDACQEVEESRGNGASLLTLSQSSSCSSSSSGSYANTLQRMTDTEEGSSKENKVVSSVPRQRGRWSDHSTDGGVEKRGTCRQVQWTSRVLSFSEWRAKHRTMECFEGERQTWGGQKMKERRPVKPSKTKIGRQVKNTAGKEEIHLQESDKEAVSPASEKSLLSIPQSKTPSSGMKHCDGALLLPTTSSVTTCAGGQDEQKMERNAGSCAQAGWVSQGLSDVPQLSVLPNPETDKEEEEHREHEKRLGKEYIKTFCEPPCPIAKPIICARNIYLTPSGERVILWTREADRAILEACQKGGANKRTFQAVSMQLGNKTASEVAKRFHDLLNLFHRAARSTQTGVL